MTASDLRTAAAELREQLPPRRTATPPAENGKRIGTIERSADEQIRVNWANTKGSRSSRSACGSAAPMGAGGPTSGGSPSGSGSCPTWPRRSPRPSTWLRPSNASGVSTRPKTRRAGHAPRCQAGRGSWIPRRCPRHCRRTVRRSSTSSGRVDPWHRSTTAVAGCMPGRRHRRLELPNRNRRRPRHVSRGRSSMTGTTPFRQATPIGQ